MTIYMFYKDTLFTFPPFWLGFKSAFSGQETYEPFLYQGYNLVFTAFPIFWWAIYDLEFSKKYILTTPSTYEIGLKNECFGTRLFFSAVLDGIVNAFFIFLICFNGFSGITKS
jgi:phospholipid-transporting ATPase